MLMEPVSVCIAGSLNTTRPFDAKLSAFSFSTTPDGSSIPVQSGINFNSAAHAVAKHSSKVKINAECLVMSSVRCERVCDFRCGYVGKEVIKWHYVNSHLLRKKAACRSPSMLGLTVRALEDCILWHQVFLHGMVRTRLHALRKIPYCLLNSRVDFN